MSVRIALVCALAAFAHTRGAHALDGMTEARVGHSSTRLANGEVLIVASIKDTTGAVTASAEIFDPTTNQFGATGSLAQPRCAHEAILLQSGKVLVVGGVDGNLSALRSAEIYDPLSGTFTAVGDMGQARVGLAVTLLASGKVLVTGGQDGETIHASAEVFDPGAGTFSGLSSSLGTPRVAHTATLLSSGKVLLAGGFRVGGLTDTNDPNSKPLKATELFDAPSNTFVAGPDMSKGRANHTSTLLSSGKVLIIGGHANQFDVFDPANNSFGQVAGADALLSVLLQEHSTTLVGGNEVFVHGGVPLREANGFMNISFRFNVASGASTFPVGALQTTNENVRIGPRSVVLENGKVPITGGRRRGHIYKSAILYDPSNDTYQLLD